MNLTQEEYDKLSAQANEKLKWESGVDSMLRQPAVVSIIQKGIFALPLLFEDLKEKKFENWQIPAILFILEKHNLPKPTYPNDFRGAKDDKCSLDDLVDILIAYGKEHHYT